MSQKLPQPAAVPTEPLFLPRITQRDGRAIEQALGGRTLFDRGVELRAGVVEATFAATDPPLLKRLRETSVPHVVDPQTVRFAGERFLQVEALTKLPYAPSKPLRADSLTQTGVVELARAVLRFEQAARATWYWAAALPHLGGEAAGWERVNDQLLAASAAANGTGEFERKPLVAPVFLGREALAKPERIIARLLDHPIDAIYVQALRLDPVRDSPQKLALFVQFLDAVRAAGVPVIAGRVGTFGLVLQALDVASAFDSGLNQAEAFDLATLNRVLSEREQERQREGRGGGADKRVYFEQLKTTMLGRHVGTALAIPTLSASLACMLDCCRHRDLIDVQQRRQQHCLWTREHEVAELRAKPTRGLRLDLVHEQLVGARELGQRVRSVLGEHTDDLPRFEHLDRWIGLLGQEAARSEAA